jgi:hypothetical protein
MGLCLSLIVIGLTIGFTMYNYVGLLLGLCAALITSIITNQIIYKKQAKSTAHLSPE